jgi:hypothetical protein
MAAPERARGGRPGWSGFPWLLVAAAAATACSWFGERDLQRSDCKTKSLRSVDFCRGHDSSWQECRYCFRAIGKADPAWCRELATKALVPADPCTFADAATWSPIACDVVGFQEDARCYTCTQPGPEMSRIYVQAYDRDCLRGAEQVTCNLPVGHVANELGAYTL